MYRNTCLPFILNPFEIIRNEIVVIQSIGNQALPSLIMDGFKQ